MDFDPGFIWPLPLLKDREGTRGDLWKTSSGLTMQKCACLDAKTPSWKESCLTITLGGESSSQNRLWAAVASTGDQHVILGPAV